MRRKQGLAKMFFIANLRLPKRSVRTEGFKNKAVYAAFHRSILAVSLLLRQG